MNDFELWARELTQFFETTARNAEAWAEQTLTDAADTADAIADELEKQLRPTLEQWADELNESLDPFETSLITEIERFSDELAERVTPIVVPMAEALETWFEAMAGPITSHVDPILNDHPTCVGCQHYYGQAHGGNMLVCAMHPFGPEEENCPDWESH